ncbi:MAG: hypothetical protein U5L08_16275 [Xanthomonadales bacterium]|nr:hypothetical protein [Xanthomonadales bacterium]
MEIDQLIALDRFDAGFGFLPAGRVVGVLRGVGVGVPTELARCNCHGIVSRLIELRQLLAAKFVELGRLEGRVAQNVGGDRPAARRCCSRVLSMRRRDASCRRRSTGSTAVR